MDTAMALPHEPRRSAQRAELRFVHLVEQMRHDILIRPPVLAPSRVCMWHEKNLRHEVKTWFVRLILQTFPSSLPIEHARMAVTALPPRQTAFPLQHLS